VCRVLCIGWPNLLSVTVQESWIKLLRIQSEGDVAQYGECGSPRSVMLQLSGCENTEKIVFFFRKNDWTEMVSTK